MILFSFGRFQEQCYEVIVWFFLTELNSFEMEGCWVAKGCELIQIRGSKRGFYIEHALFKQSHRSYAIGIDSDNGVKGKN